MKKVMLIDGTNCFLRCYAALPTMDVNGNPNGAVYGFLNSLGYFLRIVQPDHVIIAWDGVGGSKKRRSLISSYKQGRKPVKLNRNFDFEKENEQQNKIQQRLRLGEYLIDLPVTQIVIDDIEADDIVAYLVKFYSEEQKIIVSNDKDFYQLLDDKTVMFSPQKKLFINNKYVKDTFNIYPKNFAITRAIIGDQSDNLPGVRGIGMKNVIKYFPFLCEEKKVDINQLFDHASQNGDKYVRFLENKQVIINNLQCMQLNEIIISNASIQKIHDSLNKSLKLNATSFRVKLIEDGINSLSDHYLQAFRVLELQANKT